MKNQSGAALITVLAILLALSSLITLVILSGKGDPKIWRKSADRQQALYLAESGIAWQLYSERYRIRGDTLKKTDSNLVSSFNSTEDTLQFRLDPHLRVPAIQVDRDQPFLAIESRGTSGIDTVTVKARFGRSLDLEAFGPALSLESDLPLEGFAQSNVKGPLRLKVPVPGLTSLPWPSTFSVSSYAQSFASDLFRNVEIELHTALGKAEGKAGNGHYDSENKPDPDNARSVRHALGNIEINGGTFDTLKIKGPLRFYAHGEIRIKGLVQLENVSFSSESDIVFEGEVSGQSVMAYSRRNLSLLGNCQLEMTGLAGGDIHLRDQSQVLGQSILIVMANSMPAKNKADSLHAIRVVQRAQAHGFLLALGAGSRVVMGSESSKVKGVILAEEAWLAGTVEGSVATKALKCGNPGPANCLGHVLLNRNAMPEDLMQPLQMGVSKPSELNFRLVSWETL